MKKKKSLINIIQSSLGHQNLKRISAVLKKCVMDHKDVRTIYNLIYSCIIYIGIFRFAIHSQINPQQHNHAGAAFLSIVHRPKS